MTPISFNHEIVDFPSVILQSPPALSTEAQAAVSSSESRSNSQMNKRKWVEENETLRKRCKELTEELEKQQQEIDTQKRIIEILQSKLIKSKSVPSCAILSKKLYAEKLNIALTSRNFQGDEFKNPDQLLLELIGIYYDPKTEESVLSRLKNEIEQDKIYQGITSVFIKSLRPENAIFFATIYAFEGSKLPLKAGAIEILSNEMKRVSGESVCKPIIQKFIQELKQAVQVE